MVVTSLGQFLTPIQTVYFPVVLLFFFFRRGQREILIVTFQKCICSSRSQYWQNCPLQVCHNQHLQITHSVLLPGDIRRVILVSASWTGEHVPNSF